MKYPEIYMLKPGESVFYANVGVYGNRNIRQAVYRIKERKGLKLKTSERFEDYNGRTETQRGFDEQSAVLGTRVYRME